MENKDHLKDMLDLIQYGTGCGILIMRTHSENGLRNAIVEYANDNFMKMNHLEGQNIVGTDFLSGPGQVIPSDEIMRLNRELENALKENKDLIRMNLRIQPEGKTIYIKFTCRMVREEDSTLIQIIEMDRTKVHDLRNEIKTKNQRLRIEDHLIEKYARKSFDKRGICVWVYHVAEKKMVVKMSFGVGSVKDEEILNVPECLVEGKIVHPDMKDEYLKMYTDIAAGSQKVEGKFLVKAIHKKDFIHGIAGGNENEAYHWTRIKYRTIFDEDGRAIYAVGVAEDIEDENNIVEDPIAAADYVEEQRDTLTGFYNQQTFDMLAARKIQKHETNALIVLNMDDFKYVSRDFGAGFADSVMEATAIRIQAFFAEDDRIILGRMKGDEFAILISDYESREAIIYQTDSLVRSIHVNFDYEGTDFEASCSIGVAFSNPSEEYDTVMSHAREALVQAKESGKDTYRIYE